MKTVLLVDDSRISRLMLKAIVQNKYPEWTILEAENARVALEVAKESTPDVITLDMNMPGRDGLTIAPELQESCPKAHIALLTGNVQERIKTKASEQGLTYIAKPITEDKVLDYLESIA